MFQLLITAELENSIVNLFSFLGTNYRVMVRALMVDGTSVSRQQFFETSEAGRNILVFDNVFKTLFNVNFKNFYNKLRKS